MIKNQKGITLISLIVTIIVLLILSIASIRTLFDKDGILKQVEDTKKQQGKEVNTEEEKMNKVLDEYANAIATSPVLTAPTGNKGVTLPKVSTGMTRIKYNDTSKKWEKVENDKTEWYNYENKQWANVVLGDAEFNADGTLNEDKPYSQLVWIPRFAYKITTGYHTEGTSGGNIEVVFIDENNKGIDGTQYDTTYNAVTSGTNMGMNEYVVHPAFDYDGKRLTGFWVGKYESSNRDCGTASGTGNVPYTGNEIMTIRANVTSWRNIEIGAAFTACMNMNKASNPYGLINDDTKIDPHMIKNTEWGAIVYLSKSKYGKQTEEIYINNSSEYITGNAGGGANASASSGITNAYNTTGGVKASTTGNVYGVYDINGGANEYVSAYVANGHEHLIEFGEALVNGAGKYKDVYTAGKQWSSEAPDSVTENYNLLGTLKEKYGDALYETSLKSEEPWKSAWFSDYSKFPGAEESFLLRGGNYQGASSSGAFHFGSSNGDANAEYGFRVAIPVL